MFSPLIDGLRQIRGPLAVGYALLLAAWIAFGQHVPDQADVEAPASLLYDLADAFGPVTGFAAVTFAAFLIGSLAWNLFVERFVAFLHRFPDGPDWESFIDSARQRTKRYEEYLLPTAKQNQLQTYGTRSPQYGKYLWAEVEDRERRKSELEFRLTLSVALIFPAVALVARGGPWWAIAFVPSCLIWIDAGTMQDRTRTYMKQARRRVIAEELNSLRRTVERSVGQEVGKEGGPLEKQTASAKKRISKLEAELHVLDSRPDSRLSFKRVAAQADADDDDDDDDDD